MTNRSHPGKWVVLRMLDALRTGELCPCNWKAGEPTLQVA
jgi:lipoyl-dependent peroxiredoxin subunit C